MRLGETARQVTGNATKPRLYACFHRVAKFVGVDNGGHRKTRNDRKSGDTGNTDNRFAAALLAVFLLFLPVAANAQPRTAEPSELGLAGVKNALNTVRMLAMHNDWMEEVGAVVEFNGKMRTFANGTMHETHITVDDDTRVVIHTHPANEQMPSQQDIDEAKATGIPDIIVSQYAMFVVMPDGAVYPFKGGK